MNRTINVYNNSNLPNQQKQQDIIDFLYIHLGEYGDEKTAIQKCMNYALDENQYNGGFVMTIEEQDKILAAVIINKTGMSDYIPENILVYIAAHGDYRGQGLGSRLIEACIERAEGDIALHVEKNNPAKGLYEKFGFTNPYLEMRLKK
ncbi:GNAT family N-acetyltransferase [Flavobacteriaceae bacterium Ap0902]|nr:GNAT family N-acetyltransferase [Flavobacteriaceae bacterium Ap0902]